MNHISYASHPPEHYDIDKYSDSKVYRTWVQDRIIRDQREAKYHTTNSQWRHKGRELMRLFFVRSLSLLSFECSKKEASKKVRPCPADSSNITRLVKISLNVRCLLTNPACCAGVLVSFPNFNALCGRTQL